MVKGCPPFPTRVWLKSTGPRENTRTATETTAAADSHIGRVTTTATRSKQPFPPQPVPNPMKGGCHLPILHQPGEGNPLGVLLIGGGERF